MPQEIVVLLLNVLLKYGPEAFIAIKGILSKPVVTDADWDAVLKVVQTPYDKYLKG